MHIAPTEIKVGCCGLAGMGLKRYVEEFEVVELQSIFYRLPMPKTARGWREKVGEEFGFSMKVFQGITHHLSSPTWKRAGSQRPKENLVRAPKAHRGELRGLGEEYGDL